MKNSVRVGIMASGEGSNFQTLAEAMKGGRVPGAEMALLICNRADAGALKRAAVLGVESVVVEARSFSDRDAFYDAVLAQLRARQVDVLCLAGFLLKLEPRFIAHFGGPILNIHPSLLPKFGGQGMYGARVHEAVLAAGEKESGASVHWVDEEFDHGLVLDQIKVPVESTDNAQSLAARVLKAEHALYPRVLARVVADYFKIESGRKSPEAHS